MQFLTDFADEAVMLPLAAAIGLGFALSGWWRGVMAWLLAVFGVLGAMSLLKYVFFACAGPLGSTGIHSPSGHTAASSAIYGGLVVLLLRGRMPWPVLAAIPPAFAVLFGITRLAVHAHDLPEVVAGGIVGTAAAAAMVAVAGPRPVLRGWPIALMAALILVSFHGLRLHAEDMIHNFLLFSWLPLPVTCRA